MLAQRAADALVLLNLDDGTYYSLNEVGGRIWELCDGTRTVSAIISAVCEEYEAPPETVEADAHEVLADLAAEGLVVESP